MLNFDKLRIDKVSTAAGNPNLISSPLLKGIEDWSC